VKWTTALYVVRAAMSVWWCRRTVTEGSVTAVCSTMCGVQKSAVAAVIIIRRDREMYGKFNWRVRSVCVTFPPHK
jgi:hypothetical protein